MGRTYLTCPFAEKDEAKALGARWDPAKKRWYVPEGADPAPFERWLSDHAGAAAPAGGARAAPAPRASSAAGVRTGPKEVPHCGCDVLPWEPCPHTRVA